jgi:hypothetical protein
MCHDEQERIRRVSVLCLNKEALVGVDEKQPMVFFVTSMPMSLRLWLPLLSPGFRTGLMGNNSLLV